MSSISNVGGASGAGAGARGGLTARSVLLSVLLGADPPRMPVRLLVQTTELFGISEGTTRTALSRMVAAGEVEAVMKDAAVRAYEITAGRLLERQARYTVSRRGRTHAWHDEWIQAVVGAEGRRTAADRAALRAMLDAARLAELREGLWLRPDNLDELPPTGTGELVGSRELQWFRTVPDGDPVSLAARLWDLPGWARAADDLRRRIDTLLAPLEAGDRRPLADGFVLSAAVLRHLQTDPLLPAELLPARWPGDALRHEYDRYDAAWRAVLQDWFRQHQ